MKEIPTERLGLLVVAHVEPRVHGDKALEFNRLGTWGVRGSRRVGGIVCRLCESVPPDEPTKLSKDLIFSFFQQVHAGMI